MLNAVVAAGVPTAEWARGFDTAWIDFTKGLGAPVGVVLTGPDELIEQAWRYKQMDDGRVATPGRHCRGGLPMGPGPPHRPARRRPH